MFSIPLIASLEATRCFILAKATQQPHVATMKNARLQAETQRPEAQRQGGKKGESATKQGGSKKGSNKGTAREAARKQQQKAGSEKRQQEASGSRRSSSPGIGTTG